RDLGAVPTPRGDVDSGARRAAGRLSIPDGQLADLGIEIAGPQQGESHRELARVPIQDVVAQEGVVGRVANRGGGGQAAVEPPHPAAAGGGHARGHELLASKRQYHVQLGSARKQRLGPYDIRPARKRSISKPWRVCGQDVRYAL